MTFPSMESSELPQETESSEVQETVESAEVQEAAQQLEAATFEPEAMIETEISYEQSEAIETALKEMFRPMETPVHLSATDDSSAVVNDDSSSVDLSPDDVKADDLLPAVNTDEVSGNDANAGPRTPTDINTVDSLGENASVLPVSASKPRSETGGSAAIIDSNDGPRAAGLSPDDVKIDTVPLPEKPVDDVSIIDSNDGPRAAADDIPGGMHGVGNMPGEGGGMPGGIVGGMGDMPGDMGGLVTDHDQEKKN